MNNLPFDRSTEAIRANRIPGSWVIEYRGTSLSMGTDMRLLKSLYRDLPDYGRYLVAVERGPGIQHDLHHITTATVIWDFAVPIFDLEDQSGNDAYLAAKNVKGRPARIHYV
jgi:hypothetical protein